AKQAEIETLNAQQDTLRSLASVRADRIRELEAELARRDDKIAALESELAEMATKGPPPPDDLRRIRGIGPKFETRLHELGIRRFAQIAGWTPKDVAAMAEQLKIHPRRIENNGWVQSARSLVAATDAESD
ncbi:MAG: hypothetical protein JRI23_12670, partial [Deltaproteobacteria bacterium]|nr:hypothetical protein [Deltaproteobacteria bacterium]MBW2532568.1 hypothetical protein [Deltaproteobacteria bacterium]